VVTPDVAIYGGLPIYLFPDRSRELAVTCANFLGRASFHGSELHVPMTFYSEVTVLMGRIIAQGTVQLEAGKQALDSILGTTWEFHFPVAAEVLDFHHLLAFPDSSDADYLSVAAELGCTIITTDTGLIELAQTKNLGVEAVFVMNHVWSRQGALEDNPPPE
jgi:hypothetical protein